MISKQITYNMDRENFSPVSAEGMKVIYGDRTDSFRATMIPNIVYVVRNRPLHLQLMKLISHEPDRRYPLIVYVQGSGFRKQEYFKPIPQLAQFVHEGYVVASVEYRYSDEGGVFPAQVQDLKAAIRYLRAHAGEYQIDPDRIALWGDSSGGHTVALAALSDGVEEFDTPEYKEQHSNVKCCVDFYGVFEFESMCETMTPELIQYFEGDPIEKLFGGPISEHQEEVKRANLAGYITRDKVIPPFLLVHGDEDAKVHFTQSVKFYNLLKDNGHSVEFYKVKGGGHGNRTWTPEVMGLVKEFLRAYL